MKNSQFVIVCKKTGSRHSTVFAISSLEAQKKDYKSWKGKMMLEMIAVDIKAYNRFFNKFKKDKNKVKFLDSILKFA